MKRKEVTRKCLEQGLSLSVCAWRIVCGTFPITPVGNVFQSLVVLPVLQIFGADNARSSTCINKVVELDLARATVFA